MRNAMQEAFGRINNPPPVIKGLLKKHDNKQDKGVSTKLSFRTYQQLKKTGVMG
jgi:hypothetical protein